ncbi:MAG: hypothetical protein AAB217_06105 [Chloroflexota bacterium]
MSTRARVALAVIGLLFICISCAALVYAVRPLERVSEQAPVAPTLFSPPQSFVDWLDVE